MSPFTMLFTLWALFALTLFPLQARAETDPLIDLQQFLKQSFPESIRQVGRVEEKHEDRIAFPMQEGSISRGKELVILSQRDDIPVYLQQQAAVVRLEGTTGSKALAQSMVQLGGEIKPGDPVIVPMSPLIYLYTNIQDKDAFEAYQKLLQLLIRENYEVRELGNETVSARTDRYGILVRLEGARQDLVLKIQSIYSQDTFFSTSWMSRAPLKLAGPTGRELIFSHGGSVAGLSPAVPEKPLAAAPPTPGAMHQPDTEKSFLAAQPVMERDSYRLEQSFQRMAAGDIDGDGRMELVLLNNEEIEAFRLQSGRLQSMAKYAFPGTNRVGLHVHVSDLTGDGRGEILVSLLEDSLGDETDTRLASMVMTFDGTALQVLTRDMPFYLRVAEDRSGEPVVLGQKKGKYEPFEGDIVVLRWDARKRAFDHSSEYQPARNVYSVYQFNLISSDSQRIAVMEPDGTMNVYFTPSEKVESSVDRNYGEFQEIPYRIMLPRERYLGGFKKQTFGTTYVPVRFEYRKSYDDQMFVIDKGRSGRSDLFQLTNLGRSEKDEDSIVAVKWMGKSLLETWRSPYVAKDILDFAFLAYDGRSHLLALTRDKQGHSIEVLQ